MSGSEQPYPVARAARGNKPIVVAAVRWTSLPLGSRTFTAMTRASEQRGCVQKLIETLRCANQGLGLVRQANDPKRLH